MLAAEGMKVAEFGRNSQQPVRNNHCDAADGGQNRKPAADRVDKARWRRVRFEHVHEEGGVVGETLGAWTARMGWSTRRG